MLHVQHIKVGWFHQLTSPGRCWMGQPNLVGPRVMWLFQRTFALHIILCKRRRLPKTKWEKTLKKKTSFGRFEASMNRKWEYTFDHSLGCEFLLKLFLSDCSFKQASIHSINCTKRNQQLEK